VFWAQPHGLDGEPLSLTLVSRAAVSGLSPSARVAFFEDLTSASTQSTGSRPQNPGGGQWAIWHHGGLRVAVISTGDDGRAVEDSLAAAAAARPHVLVAPLVALHLSSAARSAVAGFEGAVLVVEDAAPETATVSLLRDLGITARYTVPAPSPQHNSEQPDCCQLTPKHVADSREGPESADDPGGGPAFIHNVRIQSETSLDDDSDPGLRELIDEQFAPLYEAEFGADLRNLGRSQEGYNLRISFLVKRGPAGEAPALLGFIVYKVWGLPCPGVSVCAVAVPDHQRGHGYGRRLMELAESHAVMAGVVTRQTQPASVRLRSLASAVQFYGRLGFERTPADDPSAGEVGADGSGAALLEKTLPAKGDGDDGADGGDGGEDGGPCVPMAFACGGAARYAGDVAGWLPLDPWCPLRSHHLEDGPTWLPAERLLP